MSERERQSMDARYRLRGLRPGDGRFSDHPHASGLADENGVPVAESAVMPGMPPQVICYERADDIGFGVSGRGQQGPGASCASFPDFDPAQVPMCRHR